MHVFIYRADLYCAACGADLRREVARPAHADPANESSYDSDEWPKGPYSDGGGESDTPQHCGRCGVFLRNPLTSEGLEYVRAAVEDGHTLRAGKRTRGLPDRAALVGTWKNPTVKEWSEFYGISPEVGR